MNEISKLVHTARTRTTGGREHGISRSSDGSLDVRLAAPASDRLGTTPEHLFAAAWSSSFENAIELAAQQRKVVMPVTVTVDAELDLNFVGGGYFLSARFNVRVPGIDRNIAHDLIDEAHKICPYSKATRGNIEAVIKLVD